MDRQQTLLLADVLKKLLKREGLEGELLRMEIFDAWDEVTGLNIARQTVNKYFKDGILYCSIRSSVARSELYPKLEAVKAAMNKRLPEAPVKKIILR